MVNDCIFFTRRATFDTKGPFLTVKTIILVKFIVIRRSFTVAVIILTDQFVDAILMHYFTSQTMHYNMRSEQGEDREMSAGGLPPSGGLTLG